MLIASFILNLIIFAVALVFAGVSVSRMRNTAATHNLGLLPFIDFSLSSWIMWTLQYALLVATPFVALPSGFFLDTGLWLGVIQNALWTCAAVSLHSKRFSQISYPLPLFKTLPIVIAFALLTYRRPVLTSEIFFSIDAVLTAAIFFVFALSTLQLRLSKAFAGVFFVHGYFQWIWSFLLFIKWTGPQFEILLAFLLWHITVLIAWIGLISAMLQTAQPSYEQVVRDSSA